MKWIAIVILGCSMVAAAQTAKVVQLSPEDAKEAKTLHDEQDNLTARMNAFHDRIQRKYLAAKEGESYDGLIWSSVDKLRIKSGWFEGFEYSEDFRFIVPIASHIYSQFGAGCSYFTSPVIGAVAGISQ